MARAYNLDTKNSHAAADDHAGNAVGGLCPRRSQDACLSRLVEARYEQFAEAPDSIARLTPLHSLSAVRAKFVPQDPKDEPASELLKRIAKEKARVGARDGGPF